MTQGDFAFILHDSRTRQGNLLEALLQHPIGNCAINCSNEGV